VNTPFTVTDFPCAAGLLRQATEDGHGAAPHTGAGEVHCGTNAFRETTRVDRWRA
jgi:hypothetical protein